MARDLRVKVRLQADTKDATRAVKQTSNAFVGMFSKLAGFAVVGASVGRAFRSITRFADEATTAAGEQEDAIAALDATLSKLGPTSAAVSDALQKQASELQNVTTFGDEVTIKAQAQLAVFTQNEQVLKSLTVATQDFATAQGIDLITAARLLGKTLGSSTNALIRYGVEVDGVAGSTERAESIVSSLAELFGGRAAAAADTFTGSLQQQNNALGDVLEKIGGNITASEGLTESQQLVAKAAATLSEELDTQSGLISRVATGYNNLKLLGLAALINFNRLGSSTEDLATKTKELSKEQADAAEKIRITKERLEEQTKAQEAATKAQDEFLSSVEKLGISLEGDLNSEMEKNIDLLSQADEQYRRGIITRTDFENIERAVIDTNEELNEKFREQIFGLQDTSRAFEDGVIPIENYRGGLISLGETIDDTRQRSEALSNSLSNGGGQFSTTSFGGAIAIGTGTAISFGTGNSLTTSGLRPESSSSSTRTRGTNSSLTEVR